MCWAESHTSAQSNWDHTGTSAQGHQLCSQSWDSSHSDHYFYSNQNTCKYTKDLVIVLNGWKLILRGREGEGECLYLPFNANIGMLYCLHQRECVIGGMGYILECHACITWTSNLYFSQWSPLYMGWHWQRGPSSVNTHSPLLQKSKHCWDKLDDRRWHSFSPEKPK